MSVNVTSAHPAYDAARPVWQRIRHVMAGDDAVKAAGEKYLARLDSQTDAEYDAYVQRGFFYNATARTVSGYVGLIFRRDPILRLPSSNDPRREPLARFNDDADLLGTSLSAYARHVVTEVTCTGRCGTLIDWHTDSETHAGDGDGNRAYVALYRAEDILNWRQARIDGELVLTMLVLAESVDKPALDHDFLVETTPQIRVLRLVELDAESSEPAADGSDSTRPLQPSRPKRICQVEVWQPRPIKDQDARFRSRSRFTSSSSRDEPLKWEVISRATPRQLGKPLERIPFVFHGPSHSRPDVDKSPIADLVAANLDHYRLNTDYKHGMHYTALPTAWVSGFEANTKLRIGSTTAWVSSREGAHAGFLEFKGDGLMTFERALDRTERLLAVLGSRLLESQKRVTESAEALALRQAGESSIIGGLAIAVTASLTAVLRWIYWWHSTIDKPQQVSTQQVSYELNTDFEPALMDAREIQALVAAWQSGAISRDTLLHQFRTGEILPPGRTNEEELELIGSTPSPGGAKERTDDTAG